MRSRAWAWVAVGLVVALVSRATKADAQTSLTSSSGAPTVPTLNSESLYDGSGPLTPSTTWSVTAACNNGGADCNLSLSYTASVFGVRWKISSQTGSGCNGSPSSSFADVSNGTTITTVTKARSCVFAFVFEVKPLTAPGSWTTFTAPHPGAGYVQGVSITLTKP